jgi:glycosyltransferase involved in cell wall biosynthesis
VVSSHFAPVEAVTALARTGLPVVETVHNTYAWLDARGWAAERVRAGAVRRVVAVSERAGASWAEGTGRAVDAVIPNAVHPGRAASVPRAFARRSLGLDDHRPVLVSVGRVTRQKNPDGLLRAFAATMERRPDALLLLVGPDDPTAPVSALRSRHAALFDGGGVRWLGPRADIALVLSAADLFVSDSFYEGWSVAASEAAWLGCPMVLSDAGGAGALVGEAGERGLLVPNPLGDPLAVDDALIASPPAAAMAANEEALADALVAVLDSLEAWRERGPSIREWARANLAPAAMARRHAEVLRSVVAEA